MKVDSGSSGTIWLAAGIRTPFAKVDDALEKHDALALSVPLVRGMLAQLSGARPDFAVWGSIVPNLSLSNIAREVLMEAGAPPEITAFSTVMACSTSMMGAIEAAGMINGTSRNLALVGGVESMSHIQIGLGEPLSHWVRTFQHNRSLGQKMSHVASLKLSDIQLYIPAVSNRTTGLSMGEHTEITAKQWKIARSDQDRVALESHQRAIAAWDRGFFDDLVISIGEVRRDGIPRRSTSSDKLAKLPPAFDRESGHGTLTAGNSSALTDGAAALWVASDRGLEKLPPTVPRVRVIDWEIASVDFRKEGLLMAPVFAIPRLLARHSLRYNDIALWEIHEAFAAQVLFHVAALQDRAYLRDRVGVDMAFGAFPMDRVNPNGGSVALGHPFAATGARILSQAIKELSAMPAGTRAIVSICADGGQGSVMMLEAA